MLRLYELMEIGMLTPLHPKMIVHRTIAQKPLILPTSPPPMNLSLAGSHHRKQTSNMEIEKKIFISRR